MNKYFYIFAAALLTQSFAYCSEEIPTINQTKFQYNRVQVRPDVFCYNAHTITTQYGTQFDITVNSVFGGISIGYDFIKPHSFYYGTDGLLALGKMTIVSNADNRQETNGERHTSKYHLSSFLAHMEQRWGYTFQPSFSKNTRFTPFVGLGYFYMRPERRISSTYSEWFYQAAGIKIAEQISNNLELEMNLNVMYSFSGKQRIQTFEGPIRLKTKNALGYELALPVSWHIVGPKKWNLQFQPYLLKFIIKSTEKIVGVRFQAIYSF